MPSIKVLQLQLLGHMLFAMSIHHALKLDNPSGRMCCLSCLRRRNHLSMYCESVTSAAATHNI